ncbi:hypothetical protein [Maridesulfovibrio sp.]|uniref:hypothetical protein n=1 Tax=Maridesulfovibrio sp. TaxID=2795000 RepID=UPI0039F03065
MTLDWIAIGKQAIKSARPMGNVLFLLKDISNSRKGEYDSSIKANIETYRSLLLPSESIFSSFKSKFVRRIFFDDEVNTNECFQKLTLINTEQTLDLLKIHFSRNSFDKSELYNDFKIAFCKDSGLSDNVYEKFIRCLCGYFSVFVCSSHKNRDLLSISLLGDLIEEKVNTSTSFAEMQTVYDSFSAKNVSECMGSQFRERFIEVILNVAASKMDMLDCRYLDNCFFEMWVKSYTSGLADGDAKKDAYLAYLQDVNLRTAKNNINDVLESRKRGAQGPIKENDKSDFINEISFCLALKFISGCNEFMLSSDNCYNLSGSFVIKCRTDDESEVDIIISTVTMTISDFSNPRSRIIKIGEVGKRRDENSNEFLDEIGCAAGISYPVPQDAYDFFNENGPKQLCLSLFGNKEKVYSDSIINEELEDRSSSRFARYYYAMLEEGIYGREITAHLSSKYPCLRFILRSEHESALRILNFDYFTATLGSIKTTCEI